MANVYIGSDYTITDVNMLNTENNDTIWYQVVFRRHDRENTNMYITAYNDPKFPKNLDKNNFIANVLPEVNTYISILDSAARDDLESWNTED